MRNVTVCLEISVAVQGIISNFQYTIIEGCFCTVWIVVSTLGFLGNAVNIKTFITMKLEDGVTISFLALSFSDLFFTFSMFLRAGSSVFYITEMALQYTIWFLVEPYAMYIFFVNSGIAMYITTVLTTTYLAVARCMCVTRPLHFKNAFTKTRSIIILVSFAVFTIVSYLPILVNMGLIIQYDKRTNSSRPRLWTSMNREVVKDVVWGIRDTFIPVSTQIVVIVCVIVMTDNLRKSNRFRQSSTIRSKREPELSTSKKDTSKVSRKDIQVVKQVALISFVYIICNMPKIIFNITGFVDQDLTLNKNLQNLYLVTLSVTEIFQMFNSSINVFIYYNFNSKFRSCCPFGRK